MPSKPKRKVQSPRRRLFRFALIVSILAVLATMGIIQYFILRDPGPTDTTPNFSTAGLLEVHRLTDLPTDEKEATWSPNGAQIAFVSHADGNPDIYTVNVTTGDVTQVTDRPEDDHTPQWTDASTLTYLQRPGNLPHAMDLTTETTTALEIPPGIWPWRWGQTSHDGQWTFARLHQYNSGPYTAILINNTTRETIPIFDQLPPAPPDGAFYGEAAWSLDDTYIAFVYQENPWEDDQAFHLYVYHRESATLTQLDTLGGRYQSIENLLWLDDETLLYNHSTYGEDTAHTLYRYNMTTGEKTIPSTGDTSLARLILSPSKRTLYSESFRYGCDGIERHCRYLTFTDLETGSVQMRTIYHNINGASFVPNADPDLLIFHTYAGLYRTEPKTGTWDNFVYGRNVSRISWSPSGRYLVVQAYNPPGVDPYAETLIFDTINDSLWTTGTFQPWLGALAWSPDERQVAFSSGRYGEFDLYLANLP